MKYFKNIIVFCFFVLFIGCKKTETIVSSSETKQDKTIKKMNSNFLIQGVWKIKNIKHIKEGILYNKMYYEKFKNKELKFDSTRNLKLANIVIGSWDDEHVVIKKDSLIGNYSYQEINDLVQLIRITDDPKKEYLLINIIPVQGEYKNKELVNFNQ